jgi:hypothetical protein
MDTDGRSQIRKGFCPVYDIECPSGIEAAESCENRFHNDYNPLTSFRDADIEYCALYRQEQQEKPNEGNDK